MLPSKLLRVHKEPLTVELALTGGAPRQVEVFLAEHGSHDFNRQGVLDLLEETDSFLPARDIETGDWESFNAREVIWIAMGRESIEAEGTAEELFEHRRSVRVALVGGTWLEGEILYSAPDESARTVDYLGEKNHFFRLWRADRVYLVHKGAVLRVVEVVDD